MHVELISFSEVPADAWRDADRIETSGTIELFRKAAKAGNSAIQTIERDGLGEWDALPLNSGFFEVLLAAPHGDRMAGCSVWYTSQHYRHYKLELKRRFVAGMLAELVGDRSLKFMSPEGIPVKLSVPPAKKTVAAVRPRDSSAA